MPDPVAITHKSVSLAAVNVTSVVVTPVLSDGQGGYVREVRVYGLSDNGDDTVLAVSVRLNGATEAAIQVTTPQLQI